MSSAQRGLARHDDVTRPPAMTVWIVDSDLGFVWWVGDIFREVGCRALPALSCKDAVALMKELGIEPDLIVLNPNLPGCRDATRPHSSKSSFQDSHNWPSAGGTSRLSPVPCHARTAFRRRGYFAARVG